MSSFSVRCLLLSVAYAALSCTALLNANDYWRYGFESVDFLLLLAAILGIGFSFGRRRAFWAGWFVFGAAWFWFAMGLFDFGRAWKPLLIKTGLTAIHERVFEPTVEVVTRSQTAIELANSLPADIRNLPNNRYQLTYVLPNQYDFTAVGNAVLYIPFALVGGVIATWFWRKRESERPSNPSG